MEGKLCKNCKHYEVNIEKEPCVNCLRRPNWESKDQVNPLESSFAQILTPIADLLERKNKDYGNSYAKLRAQYGPTSFLIRLADKTNRLETLILNGNKAKVQESIEDTIKDIIGYCTLELDFRAKESEPHA